MTAGTMATLSAYDAGCGAVAVLAALALFVVLARRPAGRRRPDTVMTELLAAVTVLFGGVAVIHQLVTDNVCHGACL